MTMLPHHKYKIICLFILTITLSLNLNAQNIEVLFTSIRSAQGQFVIRVFKDNTSFQDDKPFLIKYFNKSCISNKEMIIKFTMDPGIYGFAVVDDENNSHAMDLNFIGYPKEGFGFSNYYHSGLSHPDFDSFKFTLKRNQKQKITIKIRYM